MANRKGLHHKLQNADGNAGLDQQLQTLLTQHRYSQALRRLQQAQKRDPDLSCAITEASILRQQGRYEYDRGQYAKAEDALGQALALEQDTEAYYWLAKAYLAQHKEAEALELLQSAFEAKTLPKDLGGAYLKLLMLNQQFDQVEALIKTQAKRFYATQLHWARGALALHQGDPKSALGHFKKMGDPASPGDHKPAWEAYACHQLGDWSAVEQRLEVFSSSFGRPAFAPTRLLHPAVLPLRLALAAKGGRRIRDLYDLKAPDAPHRTEAKLLELVHLLENDNVHDAAHVLIDLSDRERVAYPELNALDQPILRLAGQQALDQGQVDCTVNFWSRAVDQSDFDPQLAVQLYRVLERDRDCQASQKLVNQLLTWVQKAAQKDPQAWPDQRLKPIQAQLYCWLADQQMSLRRYRDAERSVQRAAQLAPEQPEVIGRQGMQLFIDDKSSEAIPLLTQALEAGCQFEEVYMALTECLEKDKEALKAARRKFGKRFGDLNVDTEVEMPDWVEALSFQYYEVMEQFVFNSETLSPPLSALSVFLEAAEGEPSSGQKIGLDLEAAVADWDQLLASHDPSQQVDILTAIYLVMQLHGRRNQKGLTAQQSRYAQQIFELIPTVPEANLAHLMLLPLKKLSKERLALAVAASLRLSPQPGQLLAQAQLRLSWFVHNAALAPFVEDYLRQDPQNPLLLLAKATLHPRNSRDYQRLYDEGFDLARRLQDAAALQACREQDWLKAQDMTRRAVSGNLDALDNPNPAAIINILKNMFEEQMGTQVPPEVFAQMLPELMAGGGSGDWNPFLEGFDDDDEDFEDDDDIPPFFPPDIKKFSKSKKRKPWYEL